MESSPQLIAREALGDPILCFAEAGDNLLVTGTAMGRVSVWDKRMGSSTADRITQLTTCGEDAVVALSVVGGSIYATYGPLLTRIWSLSDLNNEERQAKTVKFRRNDNKAMRGATHTVHDGGVNVLILTEGQGWSHLINVDSERDIKPPLPCETGAVPCQLLTTNASPSATGERLALITCAQHVQRGSTCCVPLRKDKISCTIKLWDVMLGSEILNVSAPGAGHVRGFANNLACCNGRNVDLYSLENGGKRVASLHRRNGGNVRSVDGSSNGYVTLTEDQYLAFWNGECAQTRMVKVGCVWTYYGDEFAWVRFAADASKAVLCVGHALYFVHAN
jgi:hypothetical protein